MPWRRNIWATGMLSQALSFDGAHVFTSVLEAGKDHTRSYLPVYDQCIAEAHEHKIVHHYQEHVCNYMSFWKNGDKFQI